jgi:hypothetical protein
VEVKRSGGRGGGPDRAEQVAQEELEAWVARVTRAASTFVVMGLRNGPVCR